MSDMRIIIFLLTHNTADVLPYFLRWYSTFADEISAFDDASTDGTRELLSGCPKVLLRDWPHPTSGIDEPLFMAHWQEWYRKARPTFDWAFIVDSDELIYHPDMRGLLTEHRSRGTTVLQPEGFNMTGNGLPTDDGRQLWEISPLGVRAPVYSKPVVFNPAVNMDWNLGRHALSNAHELRVATDPKLRLLHYRYMGEAYTRAKNAKNYARCGLVSGDKGAAWSCAESYDGPDKEHSPQWAEFAKTKAFNVMTT